MNGLHLGKQPAQPKPKDLQLEEYLSISTGPTAPERFGFDGFIGRTGWGMLGNDEVGNCVWAGSDHEHMIWTGGNHRAASMSQFTTATALADYSAATGYRPGDPSTDNGTDMHEAMEYRRLTGILDAAGQRRKVGAYVALRPGDWEQLVQAIYVFEAVGIGIEFPDSAMRQFDQGEAWDVVSGARIEGGHYIVGAGRSSASRIQVVTWGSLITMTRAFYERYNDETYAAVSEDQLAGDGRSLRGLDVSALSADLKSITT